MMENISTTEKMVTSQEFNHEIYVRLSVDLPLFVGTFSILFLLRLLTRRYRRMEDNHTCSRGDRARQCDEQDFNLLGEILVNTSCLVSAIVIVSTTSVLSHPLSNEGFSTALHYTLLISITSFTYRMTSFMTSGQCGSEQILVNLVHYPIGIITYVTIMVTHEDPMLGLAGLSYQMPMTLCAALQIALKPRLLASSASLLVSVVFYLILPLTCVIISVVQESIVPSLSLWSTSVFSITTVYFGLLAIWIVSTKAIKVYNDTMKLNIGYVSIPTENSTLLEGYPSLAALHLNRNKLEPKKYTNVFVQVES